MQTVPGHKIISADSHMDLGYLPRDTFVSRAPQNWRDRVPRVVETPEGPSWVAGDVPLGPWGSVKLARKDAANEREWRMVEAGFVPEERAPADPAVRLRHQDQDGVEAEVIYGILTLQLYSKRPDRC